MSKSLFSQLNLAQRIPDSIVPKHCRPSVDTSIGLGLVGVLLGYLGRIYAEKAIGIDPLDRQGTVRFIAGSLVSILLSTLFILILCRYKFKLAVDMTLALRAIFLLIPLAAILMIPFLNESDKQEIRALDKELTDHEKKSQQSVTKSKNKFKREGLVGHKNHVNENASLADLEEYSKPEIAPFEFGMDVPYDRSPTQVRRDHERLIGSMRLE